ncbi:MAG: hypothetical protein COV43_08805 [Deltaproteobacteria bacterium CG11_big_fil_rev_8_21_14_0_20_42_23]|nr:MAG: hypothetical protein COV43_08805 [Deltaproteobacteria bacterium CG11_big_fil_rev_8_21_14_0_20_42_23]PJC64919.1 MAG: hypothetical protein CO021_01690 [Deltaproteobacteria bacterium CG_4_9_14_0_2_um_filter_42_21]
MANTLLMPNENRKQITEHLHNLNGGLSVVKSFIFHLDSCSLEGELRELHEAAKRNLEHSIRTTKELSHLIQYLDKL